MRPENMKVISSRVIGPLQWHAWCPRCMWGISTSCDQQSGIWWAMRHTLTCPQWSYNRRVRIYNAGSRNA